MDLFLYLFLSLTGIWYLAAREQDSIWPWALSGVFLCFTILNRATAPAYFAVMYGPVFLAHLVQTPAKERGKLILRAGVSWGAGLAVGCLALSSNWNFIYYYYFVWGADPNANLPLSVSRRHFDMALDNLGWLMTRAALFMLFLQVAIRRLELSPRQLLRMTYWEIFYIGCAPALLLMSRGAGLNFLVTIPCIFGWLLFAVAPLRGPIPYSRWSWLGAAVLLLTCSYYNYRGYVVHTQPGEHKVPMMQALQKGIDLMQADALARGKRTAQFTTSHIVDYQTSALRNVLIYERGAVPHEGAYRLRSGLVLRADQEWVMSPSVPLNWDKELPGATDEAKCAYLVQLANREVDYLFLPDEESINWMEHHRRQNLINLKIRMLKGQLLATGRWKAIGDPLTASAYERVILYAKQ